MSATDRTPLASIALLGTVGVASVIGASDLGPSAWPVVHAVGAAALAHPRVAVGAVLLVGAGLVVESRP